ncbi:Lipase (class 3) [Bremerella volcania]|uniref:Lipase (Class 3) n=1 Tax=Bremerella volcania TaxID=2527984 RepID=A0A518C775_9BACT|nr:SAV_2336 N-terminal domain-related protein [Bremerella volcania]QDU75052.1 Lipase (class 3) [Bremerella volcania]
MTDTSATNTPSNEEIFLRNLADFAETQGWEVTSWDLLDVMWLAAQFSPSELFALKPETEKEKSPSDTDSITQLPPPRSGGTSKHQKGPGRTERKRINLYARGPLEDSTSGMTPVRLPAPKPLQNERGILKALRPILERGPSRSRTVLDLDATVARIADEKIWELVELPMSERQLDLALVLDHGTSMDMWRSVMAELRRLFHACGAFRRITDACLVYKNGRPLLLHPGSIGDREPKQVVLDRLDPHAPLLYLILSDCVSPAWHDKAWIDQLNCWAQDATVAIAQVLPEHLWDRTTLDRGARRLTWSSKFLGANRSYRVAERTTDRLRDLLRKGPRQEPETLEAVIPIGSIFDEDSLTSLAEFLAGRRRESKICHGLMAPQRSSKSSESDREGQAQRSLASFRHYASPEAKQLVKLLAAAPAICLPLVRILESVYMPKVKGPVVEAEIWLSGLLRPMAGSTSDDPEQIIYDFHPGIREQLLEGVPHYLRREIVERTSEYVEANLGRLRGFLAQFRTAEGPIQLSDHSQGDPIAQVLASILRLDPDHSGRLKVDAPKDTVREIVSSSTPEIYQGTAPCFRFSWSPDGRRLAIPSVDGKLTLWDVDLPGQEGVSPPHQVSSSGVNQAVWSPDGKRLALAYYNRVARIYSDEMVEVWTLMGHHSDVTSVAWSPGGNLLATGTAGGTVRLWNTSNWSLNFLASIYEGPVRAMQWLDETTLAVASRKEIVIFTTNQLNLSPEAILNVDATSLAVLTNFHGRQVVLVAGGSNGEVSIWDPKTRDQIVPAIKAHEQKITGVSCSMDGSLLASRGHEGTIAVRSTSDWKVIFTHSFEPSDSPYGAVAFNPKSLQLAAAVNGDKAIELFEFQEEESSDHAPRSLHVRIVGSITPGPSFGRLDLDCREIGEELCRRGHKLVISTIDSSTAGYEAYIGYLAADRFGKVIFSHPDHPLINRQESRLRELARSMSQYPREIRGQIESAILENYDVKTLSGILEKRGLLMSGSADETLPWVVAKIVELTILDGSMPSLLQEMDRLDDSIRQLAELPQPGKVEVEDRTTHGRSFEVAELEIQQYCDVLVVIGGGEEVDRALRVARQLAIPVVSLPESNGDSDDGLESADTTREEVPTQLWQPGKGKSYVELIEKTVETPPDFADSLCSASTSASREWGSVTGVAISSASWLTPNFLAISDSLKGVSLSSAYGRWAALAATQIHSEGFWIIAAEYGYSIPRYLPVSNLDFERIYPSDEFVIIPVRDDDGELTLHRIDIEDLQREGLNLEGVLGAPILLMREGKFHVVGLVSKESPEQGNRLQARFFTGQEAILGPMIHAANETRPRVLNSSELERLQEIVLRGKSSEEVSHSQSSSPDDIAFEHMRQLNLEAATRELVKRWNHQGRIVEYVEELCRNQPQNEDLRAFAEQLGIDVEPPPSSAHDTVDMKLDDRETVEIDLSTIREDPTGKSSDSSDRDQAIVERAYDGFRLDSFLESGFSWDLALSTCAMCHLAYGETEHIHEVCDRRWRWGTYYVITSSRTKCLLTVARNVIVVVFSGTQEIRDWLSVVDRNYEKTEYGRVNSGMFHEFKNIREYLERHMQKLGIQGGKLVLTGHGIGGALATIAAAEWVNEEMFEIAEVYTFGQPAVGYPDFQQYMNERTAGRFFRFVHKDDIVPRIPPGYVHVGELIHLGREGSSSSEMETTSETEELTWRRLLAEKFFYESSSSGYAGLFPSISDHNVSKYLENILKRGQAATS